MIITDIEHIPGQLYCDFKIDGERYRFSGVPYDGRVTMAVHRLEPALGPLVRYDHTTLKPTQVEERIKYFVHRLNYGVVDI